MLNLEPIRQRLTVRRNGSWTVRRNGSWTIPQLKAEDDIGFRYCDATPSDSQMLDDLDDLLREVERLRAENEELRNE